MRNSIRLLMTVLMGAIFINSVTTFSLAQKRETKINIDTSLFGKGDELIATWLVYAGARSLWMSERFYEKNPQASTYRYTFSEELEARESMLELWKELKQKNKGLSDEYLDSLVKVEKAGFLPEYVWYYFNSGEWIEKPNGLKINQFNSWRTRNLAGHKPQTLANAEYVN